MDLYLGLDGGGTQTRLWLGGREGPPRARTRCGPSSLSRREPAAVAAALAAGCGELFGSLGEPPEACVAACGGFASAGGNAARYQAMLRTLLPRARVEVLTDAELAWRGATGGADGIVVVAGTGSIAWGRRGATTARAGGEGPGRDGGSGDWIGRQAVAAGLVAVPPDGDFAALVPAVAAHPAALPLLRRAGAELAALLDRCAQELNWPEAAAYAVGGVVSHVAEVRRALERAWRSPLLPPRATAVEAALESARGGPHSAV